MRELSDESKAALCGFFISLFIIGLFLSLWHGSYYVPRRDAARCATGIIHAAAGHPSPYDPSGATLAGKAAEGIAFTAMQGGVGPDSSIAMLATLVRMGTAGIVREMQVGARLPAFAGLLDATGYDVGDLAVDAAFIREVMDRHQVKQSRFPWQLVTNAVNGHIVTPAVPSFGFPWWVYVIFWFFLSAGALIGYTSFFEDSYRFDSWSTRRELIWGALTLPLALVLLALSTFSALIEKIQKQRKTLHP